MGRSSNQCCSGKATIGSVCVVELRVTVECCTEIFYDQFMSPAATKHM